MNDFPVQVCVGIGSNLGDRFRYLQSAMEWLGRLPFSSLLDCSGVYETDAVGPIPQGPYLNAAVLLETRLTPAKLLTELLGIEQAHGRQRVERWGPRTLDLDLLLYGDRRIASPDLKVPHPLLAERWFVLRPLCDLVPQWKHAESGRSMAELLEQCPGPPGRRVRG